MRTLSDELRDIARGVEKGDCTTTVKELRELADYLSRQGAANCPFCAGKAAAITDSEGTFYVMCANCGAEGPYGDFSRDQAIEAWNTRVPQ